MIVHFPTLDMLRLALTSATVPVAIGGAPARAAWDDQGNTWVDVGDALPSAAARGLRSLGAHFPGAAPFPLEQEVAFWPQLLPLVCEPRYSPLPDKAAVLFEVAAGQVAEIVGEILRLGNDRQALHWIGEGTTERALVRVLGPPYYTLLRALDGVGKPAPLAYREGNPHVWCQLGFRHPLDEQVHAPAGKMLLLSQPRTWVLIDQPHFRDIYEILDFTPPDKAVARHEASEFPRFQVSLRLVPGADELPAELWLLQGDGMDQLERLIQQADDALVQRLAFAVAERNGTRTVIVRARPARQPPPVLILEAHCFRPALRLPNLFVPMGSRIQPPLRRDAVAKLLANDPERVTWLMPHGDGTFTPESLPDLAFRPLAQWVDYVLDHEAKELTAWMGSTRFDFEKFVCRDEPVPKIPKAPRTAPLGNERSSVAAASSPKVKNRPKKRDPKENDGEIVSGPVSAELEGTLRTLETAFLNSDQPLDSPERQEIWPKLAALQGALRHEHDAFLCWCQAFWEQEEPPQTWAQQCLDVCGPDLGTLERVLVRKTPTHAEMRWFAAYLMRAARDPAESGEVRRYLGPAQHFLLQHEALLGVRAAWLAWAAIYRLNQRDVLALARARDRLLERLYLEGLRPALEWPGFLRFDGGPAGERFQHLREQLLRLRQMALQWAAGGTVPGTATAGYIHLIFAYGLARVGAASEARDALSEAIQAIPEPDQVHTWLYDAFAARVQQALDGHGTTGTAASESLPEDLLARLEQLEKPAYLEHMVGPTLDKERNRLKQDRYKIDKLRAHSRILEPHEKIDPYRAWHGHFADALAKDLALLADVRDPEVLSGRLRALLGEKKAVKAKKSRARVLATGLELAPRLGDAFAVEVLDRLRATFPEIEEPAEQALLLENGLFLAAHFDHTEEAAELLEHLHRLLANTQRRLAILTVETLLGNTFHGLRRLGMRVEVGRLLESMAEVIAYHEEELRRKTGALSTADASKEISAHQRLLLQVASGWFTCDRPERARPLLDKVRELLFREELTPVFQTALASAYCQTLAQAPPELAESRLLELFRRLKGVRDMFTTHTHFSLSRLQVVESAVLALTGTGVAHVPAERRLLDEDEYLVRRRLHRDVKQALAQSH